eukprot:TRINITY_DN17274_c0_g1_i9.p1 TRINITY_DN17274_c0_g1~~TRINITY_DN17274_c0_g1_i9.p1  ORF type:complete len:288 (+),score=8.95 TRINITY_DN17274_c0_g1_i9:67-930(+)
MFDVSVWFLTLATCVGLPISSHSGLGFCGIWKRVVSTHKNKKERSRGYSARVGSYFFVCLYLSRLPPKAQMQATEPHNKQTRLPSLNYGASIKTTEVLATSDIAVSCQSLSPLPLPLIAQILEGALRQVTAEGAHHNLGQGVGEKGVELLPGSLNEVACLHEAVIDGANLVQHGNHGGDLASVLSVLLHDRPNVLAIEFVEAGHTLDDGVRDLSVTDVFADFLEVTLEALQVERVVNNLESKAKLGAEVLELLALLLGGICENAGNTAEGTSSTTSLVDVDGPCTLR